ncbi:MAG: autotransporter domain-containing protein, partial [Brevundimonas sp.]
FGAGADVFNNSALLVVGEPAEGASTLTVSNLEAWNNSGRIVFGSAGTTITAVSDGFTNDRIVSTTATTFTGSGASRLVMDANLAQITQTGCGTLTAADCFGLVNGTTAGSTQILVNDVSPNVFGAYNPNGMVVVDVSGSGATGATHFVLDPTSDFWRADLNSADGVMDKGLFFYDLTLNLNKQHVIVGLPDGEAFEFTTMGQAAQSAWYSTTGTWLDRQADLRDQLGDSEPGAGIWLKISGGAAERDLINSYELFGVTYNFDTSYDQQTVSLIGGLDFVGASTANTSWVVGGMVGYVDSDVNFNASPTMASMEGAVFGLYGTYMTGGWFIDGVVALNSMDLDYQAPTLAPAPNNIYASEVNSTGFQIEGGYKLALGETTSFEPLASVSYVKTDIDAIDVPGATINWDEQTSLRGSLGARLTTLVSSDRFDTRFGLTARAWNEFEGENTLVIDNLGPDLQLTDDFSGSFGEVQGTINLFSNEAAFSAFLNAGVKFKEDYQATDATLGFRWRW